MPINELKTKFNSFFTEWFQIQEEINKCLQKFYFSAGNKRNRRSVICAPKLL